MYTQIAAQHFLLVFLRGRKHYSRRVLNFKIVMLAAQNISSFDFMFASRDQSDGYRYISERWFFVYSVCFV